MNFFSPFGRASSPKVSSAVLCGALIVGGCGARNGGDSSDLKSALQADAKDAKASAKNLKNVVLRDWKLGGLDARRRPLWKIGARETRIGEGDSLQPKRATLLDASAQLFRDGRLESSFRAARIEFLSTPNGIRMQMSGGVRGQTSVVKSQNKSSRGLNGPVALQAPRVDVSMRNRRLYAPQNVVLTAGKGAQAMTIEAKTLSADSGLARADLGGGVRARSSQGEIAAQNATWNWKSGRAVAHGKVTASRPGTVLSGDRLDADVNGARGVLSGHVTAQSKLANVESRARAGAVDFNWAARALSSRGGVTIERQGATLRAARIDSDLKLDSARASGDVTLQKDGATLRATNLQAALSGDRATAWGSVSLQRQNVTLRAARIEGFDRLTRAIATGNVSLVRDDLTATANRIEARDIGDQSQLRLEAIGDVSARNAQGRVRAGRATWSGGQIVGSGGVTLEKDGYMLSGARLSADQKFARATFSGAVRGRFADGGTIRAGRVVKNGAQISATGGVRARRGTLQLSGARLETTMSGMHARLSGGVDLRTDDGARFLASSLRYDKAADKAYGSGGVRYFDTARGLDVTGSSMTISHVSNAKRRELDIPNARGRGRVQSIKGFKL